MITLIAIFSSDPGGCFTRSPRWGPAVCPRRFGPVGLSVGKGGFSPHSCDAERRSLGWATRTGILSLYSHFRAMSLPLGEIIPLHEQYGVGFPSVGWTDTGDRLRRRFGAPEHPYYGVRRKVLSLIHI